MSPQDLMTCDEFKELAPAYALVVLDEVERSACAAHLATTAPHRGCREAVVEAEMVAARLGGALEPHPPSAHVWGAIAARVRAEQTPHPVGTEATRHRGLYHLCGWIVAAALVGFYLYNYNGASLDQRTNPRAVLTAGQAAPQAH